MNHPIGMFGANLKQQIPLKGVQVSARIRDLFCDVTVAQTYENTESQPIEAVYTFPLPLDAVLLDVKVTLGEKQLHGSVVPKREAEAKYEEAIVSGDAAIRLERVEPGLYAMNLGNLLAGERAVITFRYGHLLRWNGDCVRFYLPTTVAPRYGAPQMAAHLVPEVSLSVDHPFGLDITIDGLLAQADIASPSHRIQYSHREGLVHVGLARGQALMDRDFVLNMTSSAGTGSAAVSVADRDANVALLSWRPSFPHSQSAAPRAVKIVIDCSGSMNGDSVEQARVALKRILESLRPQDSFDIVRFGSQSHVLFGMLQQASGRHLKGAMALAESMQADLGGTEIGSALEAAYRIKQPADAPSSDLLLITDGEVHNTGPVVDAARTSAHRIFTVGVGASVAEAFVRQLADETGGACELVHPNEQMADRIVRHFQRILVPKVSALRIVWPSTPARQVPSTFKGVFDGDTIHAFAWLPSPAQGEIAIEASLENGQTLREAIQLVALPADPVDSQDAGHPVARLAAAARIAESPEEMAAVALQYQLLTDVTDFIVTHRRTEDEKASELPELRTVPHMLAAGWGGVGTVRSEVGYDYDLLRGFDDACSFDGILSMPFGVVPSDDRILGADKNWVETLGELLETEHLDKWGNLFLLSTANAPLPLMDALRQIVLDGADEETVLRAFLQELAKSEFGQALSRKAKRVIGKLSKERPADQVLIMNIKEALLLVMQASSPQL